MGALSVARSCGGCAYAIHVAILTLVITAGMKIQRGKSLSVLFPHRRVARFSDLRRPQAAKPYSLPSVTATGASSHDTTSTTNKPGQQTATTAIETVLSKQQTPVESKSLKGFEKFVRSNPISDKFSVSQFHHVEFYAGDASNTYRRFLLGLGLDLVAKSDFSTGNTEHASYVLQSGAMRIMFTAPYGQGAPTASTTAKTTAAATIATTSGALPGFNASLALQFFMKHGLGVRAVAIEVENVKDAYDTILNQGGISVLAPVPMQQTGVKIAEVELYGDVVLRLIQLRENNNSNNDDDDNDNAFQGLFLPGFQDLHTKLGENSCATPFGRYGISAFDHIVGNVWALAPVMERLKNMTGFHDFAEFVAEDVGTVDSGLNSVVLANNNERVLLPLNEPTFGTRRKSQIQTYLEQNQGEGVQHIALRTDDIFFTLTKMREATAIGGFEFMDAQPDPYYDSLPARIHRETDDGSATQEPPLSEEQYARAKELGVLIDRDDQGILMQIFTKPIGDRPTFFFEIIQRIGCMDEATGEQKPGCGGFGKGNFKDLFKSIEDYENKLKIN